MSVHKTAARRLAGSVSSDKDTSSDKLWMEIEPRHALHKQACIEVWTVGLGSSGQDKNKKR